MKNIYLIGMRGSGKTTVGKILAEKRDAEFIDLDHEIIRRVKKSVSEIVEEKGWDAFRVNEKEALEECLEKENIVLATGGGVLMFFDNGEKLKASGAVVLLKADPETLAKRISNEGDRPSLTDKDILAELEEVWSERKETYAAHADMTVQTGGRTPEQIAEEISLRLGTE